MSRPIGLLMYSSPHLLRRSYMLDVIVVAVTIVSFWTLIAFSYGCDRL
jgi:hypothetical protein